MKKRLMLTAIVVLIMGGALALAQPGNGKAGRGRGHRGHFPTGRILQNPKIVEELGLTSEQISSLRELRFESVVGDIDLRANKSKASVKLRELLSQDEPDEAAVMSAIDTVGQASIAMQKSNVQKMLKHRSILGPEKAKKLRKMVGNMKRRQHDQARGQRGSDYGSRREFRGRGERGGRDHGPGRGRGRGREHGPDAMGPGFGGPDEQYADEPFFGGPDELSALDDFFRGDDDWFDEPQPFLAEQTNEDFGPEDG